LRLKNSRGKFYAEHPDQSPRFSFWRYYFETVVALGDPADPQRRSAERALSDPRNRQALDWQPQHANCPELEAHLLAISQRVPADWRATVVNIFAARTASPEANAQAHAMREAGQILISLQLSKILAAYSGAYDRYFFGMCSLLGGGVNLKGSEAQVVVARLQHDALDEPWAALELAPAFQPGSTAPILDGP